MPKRPSNVRRGLPFGAGYVTERPNGKHQARWHDGDRWRAKTFEDHEAAEDHVREQARRHRSGYIAPESRTMEDLVDGWLERGAHRWKPNTLNTYQQRAIRYVVPDLGSLNASDVTTPRIQHWIDGLTRSGLAPAMVAAVLHIVRAAYREAQRIGIVQTNPAVGVQLPARRRAIVDTWGESDTQKVLATIEDPMWQALYRLALTTGMRPGELRALRWADIDRAHATLTIRRTMSRSVDGAIIVGESTKTGRDRTITLPIRTVASLNRWRTEQIALRLQSPNWHDGDYVFTQPDGSPLAQITWQRQHAIFIERVGVKTIRIHGLRHTAATILMAHGVNPKIVADMLGHASIVTTLDIYSHVDIDQQRAAADALERAISG